MKELFPTQPPLDQLMAEFQAENDILGIFDAYKDGLARQAEEMQQKALSGDDREYAEGELRQLEASISSDMPIAPELIQIGNAQILYLYQYAEGLHMPGSSVRVASSEVNSDQYTIETGFNDEQVNALLNQMTRFILFSRQLRG